MPHAHAHAHAQVLYDPEEAEPLARAVRALLRRGGTLLLADPSDGRAAGCRTAAVDALTSLGATVVVEPLAPLLGSGAAAGSGAEALVLLKADFDPL